MSEMASVVFVLSWLLMGGAAFGLFMRELDASQHSETMIALGFCLILAPFALGFAVISRALSTPDGKP
jgi:hypothetical protein